MACSERAAESQLRLIQANVAARAFQPGEGAQELSLSVARDAGKAHDLPGTDRKLHVAKCFVREALPLEAARLSGFAGVLARKRRLERTADNQAQHLVV